MRKVYKSIRKIPTNQEKIGNRYEKIVCKKEIQMFLKTHEKLLLIKRGNQIKNTLRYFLYIRLEKIEKSDNISVDKALGNRHSCLWEYKLAQSVVRVIFQYLNCKCVDILISSIHFQEFTPVYKMVCLKWPMTRLFIAALFIVVEVRKLPKCPLIAEWVSTLWHILIFLQKKEGVLYVLIWKYFKVHCKVKTPKSIMIYEGNIRNNIQICLYLHKITL